MRELPPLSRARTGLVVLGFAFFLVALVFRVVLECKESVGTFSGLGFRVLGFRVWGSGPM